MSSKNSNICHKHYRDSEDVRPTPFFASSFDQSRRMCFCTFPLAVLGISSGTPSSPRNHTQAGEFCQVRDRDQSRTLTHTYARREPVNFDATCPLHSVRRGGDGTHLRIHSLSDHTPRLLLRDRRVGLPHNPRPNNFAILGVRYGDHGCLTNVRVCRQDVLNLHREEILARSERTVGRGHLGQHTSPPRMMMSLILPTTDEQQFE